MSNSNLDKHFQVERLLSFGDANTNAKETKPQMSKFHDAGLYSMGRKVVSTKKLPSMESFSQDPSPKQRLQTEEHLLNEVRTG